MTNIEHTPEDELVRRGLAISAKAQTLTFLPVFVFIATMLIMWVRSYSDTVAEASVMPDLGVALIVASPLIFIAAYFGWRHVIVFRLEHPEAYRASQERLEELSRLPLKERTIFTDSKLPKDK